MADDDKARLRLAKPAGHRQQQASPDDLERECYPRADLFQHCQCNTHGASRTIELRAMAGDMTDAASKAPG